jgi:2-polyprenyl-6-hydroxyphenyl methylase/3-demethylubiquinone-9 3-methyltransferase
MIGARNDLTIYEREGDAWWDAGNRTFASLRRVHELHLCQIAFWSEEHGRGLHGCRVVDLGCGGGLLSVPLAVRGASVVGIDRSARSLRSAARQAAGSPCAFVLGDLARAPLASASADLVLLCDVIEHVDDVAAALAESARLLRPSGLLFVTTLNRTWRARLLAVTLGEGLGFVPRGTHDPSKFVAPRELASMAADCGLELVDVDGQSLRLWRTLRDRTITLRASSNTAVGYSALLRAAVAA